MAYFIALHLIAVIAWFAGLFYLPRLFVYHAATDIDAIKAQFAIMESKLYWMIMTPAMIVTLVSGMGLMLGYILNNPSHLLWLWLKIILVVLLMVFHFYCGHCLSQFQAGQNRHSERFYRIFNEIPTLLLIAIVLLAVVQPF